MDRLRSKELGSPMADVYANIKSVDATDPTTVTFTLKNVDSEFPASLTDYRTLMLCKSVADPAKEAVGTGPFVLESISAEDRAVLKKNPTYWGGR
jgi:peptide/nickel transport system substrate-binding protein